MVIFLHCDIFYFFIIIIIIIIAFYELQEKSAVFADNLHWG